jgi:predicted transposase/invertase (TIGR01784 family)
MTALLQHHPVVQQAYGQYRQFNQDARMRALDEAHQRFLHDHATDIEESHEKGIVVGVDRRNVEIAQNMKNKGFAIEVIAEMTGLSSVEIDRLS